MAKKSKMNPVAMAALQKWRAEHTDKDGHLIGIKRKSNKEILAEKQLKLAKLEKQVADLKAQIAKLDATMNKAKIKDAIKGFTADEIVAALAALKK